jgi:hypothetical protein
MYALTYSNDAIGLLISAWKISAQPQVGVFAPWEYDGAHFGCIWVQSNGAIAHV